ncbi:glycosyltransferase family 2 protein [Listeria aquatica]|uniref:Glycosyl transferase group 2 n=1 Tax=Listeria aquatica FSL S10-1188 TaxID=1265818 RepID=W7BAC0_9LIST|nr:glycosyltransferase family 2 protein [Listeria aquatica]EUJ19831.1 glycosyl transferase group 2 [Listeria aquatica FSL S10-1188]
MLLKVDYSVIIPVYNEAEVLQSSYERLTEVLQKLKANYELLFVNDGSKDGTKAQLDQIEKQDTNVKVLHFSRNFGHQLAITAGVDYASGEVVIVIDADLQDPPELIPEMIQKWQEGYDVVYAKRLARKGESSFKKMSASLFYRLLDKISEIPIPVDTGDFRLMDKKVCEQLRLLGEKNPFVRGQVSWIGFRQTEITYIRDERLSGETKYPLKKMVKLSLDGITSFSYLPLKLANYLGSLTLGIGFLYFFILLIRWTFTDHQISGMNGIAILLLVLFGSCFLLLGIIGEYLARLFEDIKVRPRYIIDEANGFTSGARKKEKLS